MDAPPGPFVPLDKEPLTNAIMIKNWKLQGSWLKENQISQSNHRVQH
jgi:hypothetical protein